jgi:hypothetical protein
MSSNARRPPARTVNPIDSATLILPENCVKVQNIDADALSVPQGTLFLAGSTI